ncbi:hypothetical protein KCP75_12015 [Salmonella enterica subsp. enterica]|nr:hypothetical protein KCP75_12015 [Salmonella enterica subsp. enterica]
MVELAPAHLLTATTYADAGDADAKRGGAVGKSAQLPLRPACRRMPVRRRSPR